MWQMIRSKHSDHHRERKSRGERVELHVDKEHEQSDLI
jgi:hypothetical protein